MTSVRFEKANHSSLRIILEKIKSYGRAANDNNLLVIEFSYKEGVGLLEFKNQNDINEAIAELDKLTGLVKIGEKKPEMPEPIPNDPSPEIKFI